MPPPPGWFSMMIGLPSVSPKVGCRTRASVSIGPPAANGTTMVTGRLGQSSARAAPGTARTASVSRIVELRMFIPWRCTVAP